MTHPTDLRSMDSAEFVYPARWWPMFVWCPVSLFCLFVGFGAVADGSAVGAAVLWSAGAFASYFAFVALRQCVHPRPRFRFDSEGFEWSAGRIEWHDVEAVALFERVRGSGNGSDYWAFLRVPAGIPRSFGDSSLYFKGWPLQGKPRWTSSGLILPFWKRTPTKPLEMLRRFYPGDAFDEPPGEAGSHRGAVAAAQQRQRRRVQVAARQPLEP